MRYGFPVFLWAACAALAQSTLSGPSLGVIYDSSAQAIRPVLGIPGSSTAGKAIDTGFAITAAAISPAHDYALAIASDGSVNLIRFSAGGVSSNQVNTAATPDRMVLSTSGSTAVLYYKTTGAIQILTGLPAAPQTGSQIDISMLPKAPDIFAVSDDGTVLLAGVSENASGDPAAGEVFVIAQDGSAPRSIGTVQHASGIAFFPQSHDVVIADDAANSITMLQDAGGQSNTNLVFTDPGLTRPDSVQVSADGKNIVAASSKKNTLAMFDAAGQNAIFVTCQCAPTEVHPMTVAAIYQVTEPGNGLMWILDSNPANPRVLFVPVPSDSPATGDGQGGTGAVQE